MKYKNQISIGTTGFYLPEFRDYNISSLNPDWAFRTTGMYISHLAFERTLNNRLSLRLDYNSLRSKVYSILENPDDLNQSRCAKRVTLFLFSAGIDGSTSINAGNSITFITKFGGGMQFRLGEERISTKRFLATAPLDGPGIKLSLSENLVYKKRYVLGINADFHAFYQPDREFQLKDHNYFMSNALYLGVKF
jgi:hypothetical protein